MLADPSLLFKVGIEVVIGSCCATFGEVQKRGDDFWMEFELYDPWTDMHATVCSLAHVPSSVILHGVDP